MGRRVIELEKRNPLTKSGSLDILAFLFKEKEVRFTRIFQELGLARKTTAGRLHELVSLRLVERKLYPVGHTYVLTGQGLAITRKIGPNLIEQIAP